MDNNVEVKKSKKKTAIIVSSIIVGLLIISLITFLLVKQLTKKSGNNEKNNNSNNENSEVTEVASVIILDINPSIKIELDVNKKVIGLIPLNEDAKDIVIENYKDKDLEMVIDEIFDNVVDNGYSKDNLVILISTEGDIKPKQVEYIFKQEFIMNSIKGEIVSITKISDTAKEKAEELGITESKAAYIENIIEESDNLTFEDLKDKSIGELKRIEDKNEEEKVEEPNEEVKEPEKEETKKEEKKEETKKEEKKQQQKKEETKKQESKYTCTPPSDLKSSEWCDWNVKRPQDCEFSYPQKKDASALNDIIKNKLGISQINGAIGSSAVKKGASYCEVYKVRIITGDVIYNIEMDYVTGEIYTNTKEVVAPKMTEAEAKQKALAYWNIKEEDCITVGVNRDLNGGPNGSYTRYQVNMTTKDGKNYSVDYNADTGEYMSSRTW